MVTMNGLDKGENVGTIFIGLSKVFDTLNQNLILAKQNVDGFSFNGIKLLQNYLPE